MKPDISPPVSINIYLQIFTVTLLIGYLTFLSPPPAQAAADFQWNTFMGAAFDDYGTSMVLDAAGNIYIAGSANGSWGTPVNAHAGDSDAFAAKLNSNGMLQWITFMGSNSYDVGTNIAVDGNGYIYVTGISYATWGTMPVRSFAGARDAFAVKLNSSGVRQWHTFLGSTGYDYGNAVAVDGSANVYVIGRSHLSWGLPLNNLAGGYDVFIARLASDGSLTWNTFIGASASDATGNDDAHGVTVDSDSNIFVVGESGSSWGTPVTPHADRRDVFVAKLTNSGSQQWNTFMGSAGTDYGYAITLDSSNNIYVAGTSDANWGVPVQSHTGWQDAFAAKLDSSGVRQWNTFMGSANSDEGYDIAVDSDKNVFLAGTSWATWGSPLTITPHSGGSDAFAAKLSINGILQWNTFLGSPGEDNGMTLAVYKQGNVFVAGTSNTTWGTPVNPHAGGKDAFIAGFDLSKFPWVLFNPAFIKSN